MNFSEKEMNCDLAGVSYSYTQLSAQSHPSFIGVKDFADTYNKKEEIEATKKILEQTLRFLHFFMNDFCLYKEDYRQVCEEPESRIAEIIDKFEEILVI